jgi:hypothetical protein
MESHWQSTKIELGFVRKNTTKTFYFYAIPTIPEILDIRVSCGCLTTSYDTTTRILTVKYKAGNIPNQVQGNQPIRKSITIIYKGNDTETLNITGTKTIF